MLGRVIAPTTLRRTAVAWGDAGRRWLDGLPGLVGTSCLVNLSQHLLGMAQ